MHKWLKELKSYERFVPFLCMKLLEAWHSSSVSVSQYIVLLRRIKGDQKRDSRLMYVCVHSGVKRSWILSNDLCGIQYSLTFTFQLPVRRNALYLSLERLKHIAHKQCTFPRSIELLWFNPGKQPRPTWQRDGGRESKG